MDKIRVRDVMSSPAIVIGPNATVPIATALMKQHHIRHLPVVENGRLVGIVSQGDVRQASITASINSDSYELHFMLDRLTASNIMARKVFTVTPDAFIMHAAELMTEKKIAGLPVIEKDGSVVGIITESDLLKMLVTKLRQAEEQQTGA